MQGSNDRPQAEGTAEDRRDGDGGGVDRRSFLGGAGTLAAGALAGGAVSLAPSTALAAGELAPLTGPARREAAFRVRVQAALLARRQKVRPHVTNGDEERYPSRIGNFSKTLPHDDFGEVDPEAYDALLHALASGDFDDMEAVPAGGTSSLLNPLGGLAFDLEGPDTAAVPVPPPPALASAEWAAQMAELYWMAVLKDVPFAEYETHPLVKRAAADLSRFAGYTDPRDKATGKVTPGLLFRAPFPGADEGPIVSQFLLRSFDYDGIPVDPRIQTAAPGVDFLTHYDEWLEAQRGFPGGFPGFLVFDDTPRYPRSARDLGTVAGRDSIFSAFLRAALILTDIFGFGQGPGYDAGNPYVSAVRQTGFSTFGFAHLLMLVGLTNFAERHAWYLKWNVHRFLRPEAGSGRVHNLLVGARDYPIHEDLLTSEVLDLIWEHNRQQNLSRLGLDEGSYLLPQLFAIGSPTHPSFPSGHAISAGACVTLLKAWFDEDAEIPDPVVPDADGLELLPYEGPPLTVGGELNKLAHNLSYGRDMSGVHWRADNEGGNLQGEKVAVALLREHRLTYPEPFPGFTLTRFDGTTIEV